MSLYGYSVLARIFHKKRENPVEFDKIQLLNLNLNKELLVPNCTVAQIEFPAFKYWQVVR
jgi:hypothetical protein